MTALDRPLFRHDHLIAEVVEDGGNKFVDVQDPDSGNLYRFYEVEYALACGMDGQRDVAGIVKWAQDELGLTPSPSEVQAVISTLQGLRFATTAEEGKAVAAELAPGIVVSKPAAAAVAAAAAKTVDVELGHSGPASAQRVADELPTAEFDLGAPGASAKPAAAVVTAKAVEDIALGAPGVKPSAVTHKGPPSEVSIDLADHLSINPADVKEAVRASKVMQAVDIPKDLLEADAAAEKAAAAKAAADKAAAEKAAADKAAAEKAAAEAAAAKAAADKAAADKAAADKAAAEKAAAAKAAADKAAAEKAAAEKAAAAKATAAAEKKPVELPKQPEKKAETKEKAAPPPAPSSGPSAALVIILILIVVGAGAFFAWKYVINKPEATPAPAAPKAELPPAPPPAPPAPTGMIKVGAPPAVELKLAAAGTIEAIEPADKDVKTGDTIAWLAGAKALQAEVAKLTAEVEKLQPAVTDAETALSAEQQKENNEAGVKAAQKKLDAAKKPLDVKKSALTLKQGELDKLAVKSTNDGKLAEPVAAGTKLEANAVVAKVAQPAAATVSFKLPAGVKLAADGSVNVAGSGAPVACKVVDAQADSISVTCPTDASLADGSTVKLALSN